VPNLKPERGHEGKRSLRSLLSVARRRLQTRVLTGVRRSRIFPDTIADKLGDDDRLAGGSLDQSVMVYFPGAPDSLYQIAPWLDAFDALHDEHPLVIVCQDSRVARWIGARTKAEVLTIARYGRLDDLLSRSDVKLVLYVSHEPKNFECLRFPTMLHAYLGHGDSDKGVSASNQLKAYDYALLPGQAAVDRIRGRLVKYDAASRCIVIGYPHRVRHSARTPTAGRCTVLYAPTWEGAQPSVAYSSVLSHGAALVRGLLADPRFRVIYRPHPLTGVTSGEYAGAHAELVALISRAARARPAAGHRVVAARHESLDETFDEADLLVCDISAVATHWLTTGRPLVVTVPAQESAVPADAGLLGVAPRLAAADASSAVEELWRHHTDDPKAPDRRLISDYYFDGSSHTTGPERFIAACAALMAERDRLLDRQK
jgi:hypothetical protein